MRFLRRLLLRLRCLRGVDISSGRATSAGCCEVVADSLDRGARRDPIENQGADFSEPSSCASTRHRWHWPRSTADALAARAPGASCAGIDGTVRTISEHQVRPGGWAAGQHYMRNAVNPAIGYR
jgi:hypothetical protein